jgi:hypothetical protein
MPNKDNRALAAFLQHHITPNLCSYMCVGHGPQVNALIGSCNRLFLHRRTRADPAGWAQPAGLVLTMLVLRGGVA